MDDAEDWSDEFAVEYLEDPESQLAQGQEALDEIQESGLHYPEQLRSGVITTATGFEAAYLQFRLPVDDAEEDEDDYYWFTMAFSRVTALRLAGVLLNVADGMSEFPPHSGN